ncbi:MAG: hypothetical protein WD512_05750 [Candidatus Paceibacterota bacterium]
MDFHTTTVTTSRAIPIPIKKTIVSETYREEYGLKKNCFDPNKSSPPNSWTSRLLERIEIYSVNPTNKCCQMY